MTSPYMQLPEDERMQAENSLAGAIANLQDLTYVLANNDNAQEPALQAIAVAFKRVEQALDAVSQAFYSEGTSE